MPEPRTLLPWIIGGAIGAGGILQGLHWRSSAAGADLAALEDQLRMVTEENELLKQENESLRSLSQGGGELAVPQPLIDRAEQECGLTFRSSPVVHRIAREELNDRVTASLEIRMGPGGIDDRQEAWRWIGWLGPEDELLASLAAVRSVGARGWFDETCGEAWVTDDFRIEDIPDQAVLVRLLSRILLHQHFPPPAAYPGDDAARAREALHQGAAAGIEARFLADSARSVGFLPMAGNPAAQRLMASLPPFIRGLTTFPNVEGKAFADTLHVRGVEPFLDAFRNPPQTTHEVLSPSAEHSVQATLALPKLPEEPYLTESAGRLGLRLWIMESHPETAERISAGWTADRYAMVPDGPSSTAVVWEIELADAGAADALETCVKDRAAEITGKQRGRFSGAYRCGPTRVRFVQSATQDFLDAMRPVP